MPKKSGSVATAKTATATPATSRAALSRGNEPPLLPEPTPSTNEHDDVDPLDVRKSPNDLTERERQRFERERREHVTATRQKNSRLSARYLSTDTFDTWPVVNEDDKNALAAVMGWTHAVRTHSFARPLDTPFLYLHGPVGSGKSGLASCAIAASLDFVPATFITRVEMMMDITRVFQGTTSGDELEASMRVAKIPLLAIDDIDKGSVTPFVLKILWFILDYRVRHEMPTIITANASLDRLYQKLAISEDAEDTAHAIVDRIVGESLVIALTSGSKR